MMLALMTDKELESHLEALENRVRYLEDCYAALVARLPRRPTKRQAEMESETWNYLQLARMQEKNARDHFNCRRLFGGSPDGI